MQAFVLVDPLELCGDPIVFLNEGAPRDFRWMCSQDQLAVQCEDRLSQSARVHGLVGDDTIKECFKLGSIGKGREPLAGRLCLFGDIRQVQELVERSGDGDEVFVVERFQDVLQGLIFVFGPGLSPFLGERSNLFDLLQKGFAMVVRHGLAEQLAQDADAVSQAFRDQFFHSRHTTLSSTEVNLAIALLQSRESRRTTVGDIQWTRFTTWTARSS
ncbi:MAG: hypothetical protein U5O39_14385 [Gammaproteobacteria bacterium]|nr:hypothetical protein [Gammaproteobacteria bacterium]